MFYNMATAKPRRSGELKPSISQAGEETLTFDLHSLATLAAARALETGGETVDADQQCPIRKKLNLRRKCSWTPRHEPVRWHPITVLQEIFKLETFMLNFGVAAELNIETLFCCFLKHNPGRVTFNICFVKILSKRPIRKTE